MPAYRLRSTHHNPDGSVETPAADILISAQDDRQADAQARDFPLEGFVDDADFAWLTDEEGRVVCCFPVAPGRAT